MAEFSAGEYFDFTNPTYLQQGDIIVGVPLLTFPPIEDLHVIRTRERQRLSKVEPGIFEICKNPGDAFEDGHDFTVIRADEALAAVITPTCDLDQRKTEIWLVCPILEIDPADTNKGNILAGKIANMFPVPAHPDGYFAASYFDLANIRPVHHSAVRLKDRIASLKPLQQKALSDHLSRFFGRFWGYRKDEPAPSEGKYRCLRDIFYFDLPFQSTVIELKSGEPFPECPNCDKIHKAAQWIPLAKHKRS